MRAMLHDSATQQGRQRGVGERDGWQGDHRASASVARRGANAKGGLRLRLARGGVNDALRPTTAKPTRDPAGRMAREQTGTTRGAPHGDRTQRGQQVPMERVHAF
jgi:hypothetical protein